MKKHPVAMTLVAALVIVLVVIVAIDARPQEFVQVNVRQSAFAPASSNKLVAFNATTTTTGGASAAEIARVGHDITGMWQSVDDPKNLLTLFEDRTYTDTYRGYPGSPTSGQWHLLRSLSGTPMAAYYHPGYVTLLMIDPSVRDGILATNQYFDIEISQDGTSMRLIYLGRSNTSTYIKLK